MAWISENKFLSMAEMENNAEMLYYYFSAKGWTLNAICGMLGNMQSESSINPGIWQDLRPWGDSSEHGFGLVQWTPYTKITDWLTANGYPIGDGDGECARIQEEMETGEQWIATSAYPMSFEEFHKSSDSTYDLALAFLANYERPFDPNQPIRGTQAEYWYEFLQGKGCEVTPRLTDSGMRGDPYWYSLNPFYVSGFGLPNCTCYCWGRRYEITESAPDTSLGNADTWFQYAVNKGQKTGREPKLGGIMCWGYTGGYEGEGGHVSIVEEIHEDGSITTSNSAWGGAYFYLQTLRAPWEWSAYTQFQGCIYLDCEPTPPTPPKPEKRKGMPLWMYLFP